jgi:hypothetical protein
MDLPYTPSKNLSIFCSFSKDCPNAMLLGWHMNWGWKNRLPSTFSPLASRQCISNQMQNQTLQVDKIGPFGHILGMVAFSAFWLVDVQQHAHADLLNPRAACTSSDHFTYSDTPFVMEECCHISKSKITYSTMHFWCHDVQRMRKFFSRLVDEGRGQINGHLNKTKTSVTALVWCWRREMGSELMSSCIATLASPK